MAKKKVKASSSGEKAARRQRCLDFPPLREGGICHVTRYSGQKYPASVVAYHNEETVSLYFGMAGMRVAYLYGENAGHFTESSMKDWHIDDGTLERMRAGAHSKVKQAGGG